MSVPRVIRSGDDGNLMCLYDLEGEHLYSTRWYRYRREFYRYTPKENPAKKTFPIPGINVEVIFELFDFPTGTLFPYKGSSILLRMPHIPFPSVSPAQWNVPSLPTENWKALSQC